ncbi:MAG: lipid-A-disaccharide synthase [Dictyoglomaceae bacterium]|nr:lipid-A-disaccharide synthase [Dictyoglomaceae bacterium]HPU43180.1 lipid-A-disaccharide synthase [Dictyoglomaceae bacterium]
MKIMFSVLEVSADIHGAKLIQALKEKRKDLYIYGIGGERMEEEGMELISDVTQYSTVGYIEPLPYIPKLLDLQKKVRRIIKDTKPDLIIFIDAQGFNIPLAKYVKKLDIPTIYYFSPQYWLFGKKEKAKEMVENLTWIIATFPQEYEFYKNFSDNVVFFGHPLIDYLSYLDEVDKEDNLIGIFPGSRIQEIKNLTPIFMEIVDRLYSDGFHFTLPLASNKFSNILLDLVKDKRDKIEVVSGKESQKVLKMSNLALAASGTVTLEAAILETPVFVFYKISPLSFFMAKRLVHYPYVAIPNILGGKMIFPEYVQYIDMDNVIKDIKNFLSDVHKRDEMIKDLKEIVSTLGDHGVLDRISNFILSIL